MQKRDLIRLRPGMSSDEPFIYTTWLKGYRYSTKDNQVLDQNTFFRAYHKVIESLLSRPTIQITIACLHDDEDVILGYSVQEPKLLHWVYVKPPWRGIGLCRDLVSSDIEKVTHMTYMGFKCKPNKVEYEPIDLEKL